MAFHLGDVNRQLEKFSDALRWYARAQKLSTSDATLRLDAQLGHALALRGLGRYHEALRIFSICRRQYARTQDREALAFVLWAMGSTERFCGKFIAAEKHLRDSIDLYKKNRDASGLAYARAALGGTLRMQGRALASGKFYRQANKTFRSRQDRFGEAYTYCGQGNAQRMRGHLAAALPFMNRAIALYQRLGMKGPLGFVLWSRGQLRIQQRQFNLARTDIQTCARLFRSVRDERGGVYALLGLGELARAQDESNSGPFYRAALNAARRLKLPFEELHARRGLAPTRDFRRAYARLGVHMPSFQRYLTLP